MNATLRDWITGAAIGILAGPLFFIAIIFLVLILNEPYGLLAYFALLAVPMTHYPLRYAEKADSILRRTNRTLLFRFIRILIWTIAAGVLGFTLPIGWFVIAIVLQLAICLLLDAFMWGQRYALPSEISNQLIPQEKRQSLKRMMIHPTGALIVVIAYALLHFLSSDPRIMSKRPILVDLVLTVAALWCMVLLRARQEAKGISRWRSVLIYCGFLLGFIVLPFWHSTYTRAIQW